MKTPTKEQLKKYYEACANGLCPVKNHEDCFACYCQFGGDHERRRGRK